jgi:hypothetical protein
MGTESKDGLDLTLHATGTDEAGVKASVEEFESGLASARKSFQESGGMMPPGMKETMKPMSDFLGSITTKRDGANVRISARLPGSVTSSLLMLPMMMMGTAMQHEMVMPPPAVNSIDDAGVGPR